MSFMTELNWKGSDDNGRQAIKCGVVLHGSAAVGYDSRAGKPVYKNTEY